jgi:putative oxidoreductase
MKDGLAKVVQLDPRMGYGRLHTTVLSELTKMMLFGADRVRDGALLLARVLLSALFLIFGWAKLTDFGATVGDFTRAGVPHPDLATIVAIVMELLVGILIVLGVLTRPLAVLLALYTLGTALIGHPYWTMTGAEQLDAEISFYKNISIIGGLILLYVTGAGRYAVDAKFGLD